MGPSMSVHSSRNINVWFEVYPNLLMMLFPYATHNSQV